MEKKILIAGFGGQGILFAGKFLANIGLNEDKQVSWLPSYGPEMRGGTANCSIILSDSNIGSPIVDKPDILVAMNTPSLDKYVDAVNAGGTIFVDSALIDKKVERTDVDVVYIPASNMAKEYELSGLANMIIVGAIIKKCNITSFENTEVALQKVVPPAKVKLFEPNKKALTLGYDFVK